MLRIGGKKNGKHTLKNMVHGIRITVYHDQDKNKQKSFMNRFYLFNSLWWSSKKTSTLAGSEMP